MNKTGNPWSRWDPTQLAAPRRCLFCGEAEVSGLCRPCLGELEPLGSKGCRRCGNPAVHRDAETCRWCDRLKGLPDELCSLYAYREMGMAVFRKIKYGGYYRLLNPMLKPNRALFFEKISFLEYNCLVPVPETFKSKFERYFNPAALIADRLSRISGIPSRPRLAISPRARRQVGLTYEERRKNTKNRFRARGVTDRDAVILVDDVLTSGATLAAATRVLRRAGVRRIAWFTLFRTP